MMELGKEFPDRVIPCDAIAVSIQPATQSLGVTFLDENGNQVLLSMRGVLLRGLTQEIETLFETVPDAVSWGRNEPRS